MNKKQRDAAAIRVKRDTRKLNGLCPDCGEAPMGTTRFSCDPCAVRMGLANKRVRDAIKLEVFNHYGGVICKCCGESHPMLLTIDHINEDGAAHRRSIFGGGKSRNRRGTGGNMYVWLRSHKFPEGFQVLCFNCNAGKHINGGICPHQTQTQVAAS